MKYLFIKLKRDIIKLWPQFLSIFMMSLLAITIFSGMEGVWNGMNSVAEKYYSDTNLSDIWVYGKGISDTQFQKISDLDGVEDATRSMTLTLTFGEDSQEAKDIKTISVADTSTMKPLLRKGTEFSTESDGIWLDESFVDENDISVGDNITLSYTAPPLTFSKTITVKGLILDSEFIFYTGSVTESVPDTALHGYAIVSEEQAKELYGMLSYNEIRLNVSKDCDYDKLEEKVQDILGDNFYNFLVRDDVSSVHQIEKEANQMQTMAILYSLIFILLALLTMYTTMNRLVNNQRIQIGTMKALGFKNSQIRLHYALYGFVVTIAGGIIGSFLGQATVSRTILRVKKITLTLPEWKIEVSVVTYLIILLIAFVCTLSTIVAANKTLKDMPAETMRGNAGKANHKMKEAKETKMKVSFEWRWVIRDIERNKVRYLMGIIGVIGSMVLMIAGFGIKNSIDFSNDYVYNKQYSYDYKAILNQYSQETYAEIEEQAQDFQSLEECSAKISNGSQDNQTGVLTVMDDYDHTYIHLETEAGDAIKLPKQGAVISRKLAKKIGVEKGDTISFMIPGISETISVEIKEIALAPAPQGIFLSKESWENLGQEFIPSSILFKEGDYKKLSKLECFKEMTSIDKQIENAKKLSKNALTITMMLIGAALLLSIVILYNLGMLNFVERFREYATMEVLGFRQSEIRGMVLRDCIATTLPGWIVGIPCGVMFLNSYIRIVAFNNFEWIPTIKPAFLVLISMIIVGCSLCVSLIVAHKVKKIDMVTSLKSVE